MNEKIFKMGERVRDEELDITNQRFKHRDKVFSLANQ